MERISALGKVRQLGQHYQIQLKEYVQPLVEHLDELLDKRLVATFVGLLDCIIRLRHQKHGLLLSELGGQLLSPDQAPAGTKRIGNLLRSENWDYHLLEEFVFEKAFSQLQQWLGSPKRVFALWDDSVVEKHKTMGNEDLCSVRSTKARRLTRIRPGYYRYGCHRTGKRYKDASVPLYRTRQALCYLFTVNHLLKLRLHDILKDHNSG
jgi:hypothetical protein